MVGKDGCVGSQVLGGRKHPSRGPAHRIISLPSRGSGAVLPAAFLGLASGSAKGDARSGSHETLRRRRKGCSHSSGMYITCNRAEHLYHGSWRLEVKEPPPPPSSPLRMKVEGARPVTALCMRSLCCRAPCRGQQMQRRFPTDVVHLKPQVLQPSSPIRLSVLQRLILRLGLRSCVVRVRRVCCSLALI